jgi:ABC-type polysaccharide/polyol phosphate transport system ATPase subunit
LLPSGPVNVPVRDRTTAAPGDDTPPRAGGRAAAIAVSHVSKSFRLPHEQFQTLKERVLHPSRARKFDLLRAVEDLSVEIAEGESFGIVGRNGSGKSTLLKCVAGIYDVDSGSIALRGRLSPFIELGVGFNPELTARDNIMINAIMLGLSRQQARERFPAIVEFAELDEFLDLKLKNYSSGMMVRLAFAVAVQVDADVLLVDEVLAVGDAAFQSKCFAEFERLKAAGKTIVFVTHDMGTVETFCDRAMLLERGRVVDIGAPTSIAREYNALNFDVGRRAAFERGELAELGQGGIAEITQAWFESPAGEKIVSAQQGDSCRVRLDVRFRERVADPVFSIGLFDEAGHVAFVAHSHYEHGPSGQFVPGERARVTVQFENWLAPARYHLTASVQGDASSGLYDKREDFGTLVVSASKAAGGVVDLPHSFQIDRT